MRRSVYFELKTAVIDGDSFPASGGSLYSNWRSIDRLHQPLKQLPIGVFVFNHLSLPVVAVRKTNRRGRAVTIAATGCEARSKSAFSRTDSQLDTAPRSKPEMMVLFRLC